MNNGIKKPPIIGGPVPGKQIDYIVAVLDLSLQQDFEVPEQQDLLFEHFFFFPPSAKLTPVTSKAAVAINNTFFMIGIYLA